MNDLTPATRATLERFSAGEISRIELGQLIGEPISFGDMLAMLHQAHLPLPRYGRPFNPVAIRLVKELAIKNAAPKLL